jgi:hypothetical protein
LDNLFDRAIDFTEVVKVPIKVVKVPIKVVKIPSEVVKTLIGAAKVHTEVARDRTEKEIQIDLAGWYSGWYPNYMY